MKFFSFQMGKISVLLEILPGKEDWKVTGATNGEIHIYCFKLYIIISLLNKPCNHHLSEKW